MTVVEIDGKVASRYENMFGKKPGFSNQLHTWGKAGTMKLKTKHSPKLVDKGVHCILLGYLLDNASDCCRMWNSGTNGAYVTCDIIWLKIMFYQRTLLGINMVVEPSGIEN